MARAETKGDGKYTYIVQVEIKTKEYILELEEGLGKYIKQFVEQTEGLKKAMEVDSVGMLQIERDGEIIVEKIFLPKPKEET